MIFELPFPAKILWPNGRGHHMAKYRETKKHREWAHKAMLAELRGGKHDGTPVRLRATFHPKTANKVDEDNASASLKAYQDGIAQALGMDDSAFGQPIVHIAEPRKGGAVIIEVEAL